MPVDLPREYYPRCGNLLISYCAVHTCIYCTVLHCGCRHCASVPSSCVDTVIYSRLHCGHCAVFIYSIPPSLVDTVHPLLPSLCSVHTFCLDWDCGLCASVPSSCVDTVIYSLLHCGHCAVFIYSIPPPPTMETVHLYSFLHCAVCIHTVLHWDLWTLCINSLLLCGHCDLFSIPLCSVHIQYPPPPTMDSGHSASTPSCPVDTVLYCGHCISTPSSIVDTVH
jgi:hypothetical protein